MNKMIVPFLSILILTSCASQISPDVYSVCTVGEPTETRCGTIKNVRCVTVAESDQCAQTGAGLLAGGVVGGVAGNQVGKGRGNTLATVGGAIAGAAAGAYAEKKLKEQKGVEYVVELDNGELMTIVQGPDSCLQVGQKVYVMIPPRGRARVVRQ